MKKTISKLPLKLDEPFGSSGGQLQRLKGDLQGKKWILMKFVLQLTQS